MYQKSAPSAIESEFQALSRQTAAPARLRLLYKLLHSKNHSIRFRQVHYLPFFLPVYIVRIAWEGMWRMSLCSGYCSASSAAV